MRLADTLFYFFHNILLFFRVDLKLICIIQNFFIDIYRVLLVIKLNRTTLIYTASFKYYFPLFPAYYYEYNLFTEYLHVSPSYLPLRVSTVPLFTTARVAAARGSCTRWAFAALSICCCVWIINAQSSRATINGAGSAALCFTCNIFKSFHFALPLACPKEFQSRRQLRYIWYLQVNCVYVATVVLRCCLEITKKLNDLFIWRGEIAY